MNNRHSLFALLVPMLAGFCAPAIGTEKLDIRHYTVSAKDLPELRDSLRDHGPEDKDGQRFHARTEWNIRWRFDFRSERSVCRINNIDTRITATMTLPEWEDKTAADEDDQQAWQHYSKALRQHEDGHYLMATSAASDIHRQLAKLSAPNCDKLAADFNVRAEAILDAYRLKEIAYDRDTGHGQSQGAIL